MTRDWVKISEICAYLYNKQTLNIQTIFSIFCYNLKNKSTFICIYLKTNLVIKTNIIF